MMFRILGRVSHTSLRSLDPDIVFVKGVLVGVEALKRVVFRIFGLVHGGILLMTKYDARAGGALSVCLEALPAYGALFVAFRLPGPTSETGARDLCQWSVHGGVRSDYRRRQRGRKTAKEG